MHTALKKEFDQLEDKKTKIFQRLSSLSEEQLSQQPNPYSWSIKQVLAHLHKIEAGNLAYIQKKLSFQAPLKKGGMADRLRSFALHTALRIPAVKYKAPKPLQIPAETSSMQEIQDNWAATRAEMEEEFEKMSEKLVYASFFKNLNVGYIRIIDQMSFLNLHFDRHLKQINRILKSIEAS